MCIVLVMHRLWIVSICANSEMRGRKKYRALRVRVRVWVYVWHNQNARRKWYRFEGAGKTRPARPLRCSCTNKQTNKQCTSFFRQFCVLLAISSMLAYACANIPRLYTNLMKCKCKCKCSWCWPQFSSLTTTTTTTLPLQTKLLLLLDATACTRTVRASRMQWLCAILYSPILSLWMCVRSY